MEQIEKYFSDILRFEDNCETTYEYFLKDYEWLRENVLKTEEHIAQYLFAVERGQRSEYTR